MSYQSNNLDLEVLEEGDPADLTTVSDNFDKIDANIGNVATFETSPATAAHNIGDYIIYQGHVHRVIANISEGNYLIRGTNISYTDVWHEIKSLRDSVSLESWHSGAPYYVSATRVGRIVTLTVISDAINGAGQGINTTIATLPKGWRPAYNVVSDITVSGSPHDLTIYPDGTLNIWNCTVQNGYIRGNLTYVTSG